MSSASPATSGVPELPASARQPVNLVLVQSEREELMPEGYGSVRDLVGRAEGNASRKATLAQARKDLANDPSIENTLSALRLRLGLSQADLADICGTSQPHIARVEAGDDVRISTLLKLSSALGVAPGVAFEAALTRLRNRE
jgi:DNA-binding Xre family transcriptional regulator